MAIQAVLDTMPAMSRVLIYGVPAGEAVTGHDLVAGTSWEAVRRAPGAAFVDSLAPVNTSIQYRTGNGALSNVMVRETQAFGAITSLDGSLAVPIIMPHSWTDNDEPDMSAIQIGDHVWTLSKPDLRRGTKPIQVRVEGEHIEVMRDLILIQQPVALLHAPCPLPHCMVPAALTGTLTGVTGEASPRKDLAEMIYTLSFLPRTVARAVPAWTWWHTLRSGETWHGLDVIGEMFA